MKKRIIQLSIFLLIFLITLAAVHAQIAIESFSSNPNAVQPGEEIEVEINLENVGEDDIENILVSLDLTDLPFAPIESSTEKIIDEIRDGDQETVSFQLVALSSAEAKTYKVPVTLTYENTTKSSLISLEVTTDANVNILLESSDLVIVDEQGAVTIKMVNEGLTQVKFLQVSLLESSQYDILSPSSVYVGEIDTGDFETEEFTILPKTEDPELKFKLEYRDTNNQAFEEEQKITVKVYSAEDAVKLGLVKQSNSFTGILIFVVIALALGAWIRRKIKKKNVH